MISIKCSKFYLWFLLVIVRKNREIFSFCAGVIARIETLRRLTFEMLTASTLLAETCEKPLKCLIDVLTVKPNERGFHRTTASNRITFRILAHWCTITRYANKCFIFITSICIRMSKLRDIWCQLQLFCCEILHLSIAINITF